QTCTTSHQKHMPRDMVLFSIVTCSVSRRELLRGRGAPRQFQRYSIFASQNSTPVNSSSTSPKTNTKIRLNIFKSYEYLRPLSVCCGWELCECESAVKRTPQLDISSNQFDVLLPSLVSRYIYEWDVNNEVDCTSQSSAIP
ncbi:hypothetical protein OCU04_006111, partial [Sclerotinia nivalis]